MKILNNILESFKLKKLRDYLTISNSWEILRRYFVLNAFDGTITTLGILSGSYIMHNFDTRYIIGASLGASFAMSFSGFAGAFLTERAERLKEIKELERRLFVNLERSIIGRALNIAVISAALVDALAPLLFSIISLMPFFFVKINGFSIQSAYLYSFATIFTLLFLLGVFLALISKENPVKYGLIMFAIGVAIGIFGIIIGGIGK